MAGVERRVRSNPVTDQEAAEIVNEANSPRHLDPIIGKNNFDFSGQTWFFKAFRLFDQFGSRMSNQVRYRRVAADDTDDGEVPLL